MLRSPAAIGWTDRRRRGPITISASTCWPGATPTAIIIPWHFTMRASVVTQYHYNGRLPMELILVIVVVVLLFGGGGYWGRGRGYW
jgi:hypothetical protein